ncbi:hypothetical protein OKW35_008248 [Paraburkholderia sp. MM5477-R1]
MALGSGASEIVVMTASGIQAAAATTLQARIARHSTPSPAGTACSASSSWSGEQAYDPPKNTGFIPLVLAGLPICCVPLVAGP